VVRGLPDGTLRGLEFSNCCRGLFGFVPNWRPSGKWQKKVAEAAKTFSADSIEKNGKILLKEAEKCNDGIYVICHLTPHLHYSAYLGN